MGGGFGGQGRGPTRFDEQYRVYPVIMMDKGHMEDGDKILLPSSALEAITRMEVDWPIMLKVANEVKGRRTHCGVLEFTATEGCCFMPHWIMQNLLLAEGDIVRVQNVSLDKCSFIKLQPLSEDFLESIQNPRPIMEHQLRKFSCVSMGDQLRLPYLDTEFFLEVKEVQAWVGGQKVPAEAASIIETDCEVDFAPPPGYERRQAERAAAAMAAAAAATASAGASSSYGGAPPPQAPAEEEAPADPWAGLRGSRLDGKATAAAAAAAAAGGAGGAGGGGAAAATAAAPKPEPTAAAMGSSIKRAARKPRAPRSAGGKNFAAFSGGGHSLGGS